MNKIKKENTETQNLLTRPHYEFFVPAYDFSRQLIMPLKLNKLNKFYDPYPTCSPILEHTHNICRGKVFCSILSNISLFI